MGDLAAEQDEALRPDLLTLCVTCAAWTHIAFQLPGVLPGMQVCLSLCMHPNLLICVSEATVTQTRGGHWGIFLGRSILSALHKTLEAEDWGLCCMSLQQCHS